MYDFKTTWIEQKLDSECLNHIRRWLAFPQSACVSEITSMSRSRCGLGIQSFKHIHGKLWLKKQFSQKNSLEPEFKTVWHETNYLYTDIDSIISNHETASSASTHLQQIQSSSAETHFLSLNVQGAACSVVLTNISSKNIGLWSNTLQSLPSFLFQFARKALQQLLPTSANLVKWGKATNSTCRLCNEKPQTNRHILSNCGFPSQLERDKTCHNNILILLAGWMKAQLITGCEICVDIASSGYSSIDLIFQTSVRPDLIIYNNASISVLELPVCHELNLLKSKLNKQNKYKNLKMFLQPRFRNHIINVFTLEVSTLSFISRHI